MEPEQIKKIKVKNFGLCFSLTIFSAFVFALANPNPLFKQGLSFVGWFMYVPFFFLIKKSFFKTSWLYTGLFGVLCVCAYAFWLYNYDSLCLYIAIPIGFLACAILGLALKSTEKIFVKNAWLVQFLILCSFDYLRTLGFLGFHYGIAAYTQWKFTHLIQICSIIGVFGLNAFVIFSSSLLFAFFSKIEDKKYFLKKMISDDKHYEGATYINYVSENTKKLEYASLKLPIVCLCLWFVLFVLIIIQGNIKINKTKNFETVTAVTIQNNDDPDENGIDNFTESVQTLITLTNEALEMNPQIKLVIWPENAVVPSIVYHFNQEQNTDRKKLVSYVIDYVKNKDITVITGNQHIEVSKDSGKKYYNAALLLDKQSVNPLNPEIYKKMHLVPFSEYFPYEKYFPHVYKSILERQKYFSEPGKEIKLFKTQGLSVYTPICFENNFPGLCRQARKQGAGCFVCLVNDSWAKSEVCQYQHLSMAVLRAVENSVPVAVSAVSGQTGFIDPQGRIMAMAVPFTKSYVISELPVIPSDQKLTVYNTIGDVFGYGIAFLLLVVLIIRGLIAIINKVICQNAQKQEKRI